MDGPDDISAQRTELEERFAVASVAFSPDGRDVRFAGPLTLGLEVGGMAIADLSDGSRLVLHVRDLTVVEREGLELDIDVSDVVAGAGHATVRPRFRSVSGSAAVLGSIDELRFSPHPATAPFGERPVRPATDDEVTSVSAALDSGQPTIEIGTLVGSSAAGMLRAKGFARHTFVCGQSGSGKTYTTGVIFERLLAGTELPLLVFDPNSDHVHLGSVADPDDHSPDAARYRQLAPTVHTARARGLGGRYTLCVDLSDLPLDVQARLLRLDPIGDLDAFAAFRRISASLGGQYSVAEFAAAARREDATGLASRIDNLELADWTLWRRDGETSIATAELGDSRCLVLDLGSLPRPAERSTLALAVLGRLWSRRAERRPVLVAVDEAHNVFPAVTNDPLLEATADLGALIAGEGRKFGLHLFVATQRPGKVHANVVSQCDNLMLMRMNGRQDVDALGSLFSHVPEPLLRRALGFSLGQALFAGPIAPTPIVAQIGARITREGGGDVPTSWAATTP
jgi:DNA helicase HerA-like ATPase